MTKQQLILKYEKQLENQKRHMLGMSNKGYSISGIHTKIDKIEEFIKDIKEIE